MEITGILTVGGPCRLISLNFRNRPWPLPALILTKSHIASYRFLPFRDGAPNSSTRAPTPRRQKLAVAVRGDGSLWLWLFAAMAAHGCGCTRYVLVAVRGCGCLWLWLLVVGMSEAGLKLARGSTQASLAGLLLRTPPNFCFHAPTPVDKLKKYISE